MSQENSDSTPKKSSSLLTSGLVLTFFTLCSRILGLCREMTKATFLGKTKFADAFGIAFMIPNLLRRLFAENAISVAFIPTFKGYLGNGTSDENTKATKDFLNATITLVTFLTTCVVLIGIAVTRFIVPVFYDGTDSVVIDETILLTRIMFPYLAVISIAAFFQGVLNGAKVFWVSGFTPVLFNSIVIGATYLLTPLFLGESADPDLKAKVAARAMSVGVISGGCVQALFQLPFVIRTGWGAHFTSLKNAFTNPGTKKVIKLIIPTIIGMACYQLNDVVSTALAGWQEEGTVATLQYSLRLQELILGVFAVSIGSVILPDLAGLAKEEKWEDFNRLTIQSVKIITLISIPVTFFSMITGREIVSLVYKTGRFDDEAVTKTTEIFLFHMAGLFFIAVNRIISPAFYAQGNTKLPTLAGILGFAFNIAIASVLIFTTNLGGNGIALALSAASAINTIFLFAFLKKTQMTSVRTVIADTILYALKMIVLSLIAAVPAYFIHNMAVSFFTFEKWGRLFGYGIPLAITGTVFAVCGLILLAITKDDILKSILKKIKK